MAIGRDIVRRVREAHDSRDLAIKQQVGNAAVCDAEGRVVYNDSLYKAMSAQTFNLVNEMDAKANMMLYTHLVEMQLVDPTKWVLIVNGQLQGSFDSKAEALSKGDELTAFPNFPFSTFVRNIAFV